jgi:murein L,D-transpeptidase YafK
MANRVRTIAVAILAAVFLAGCQVSDYSTAKHLAPVPGALKRKMALLDMEERAPILVRIFKEDDELEVWKRKRNGEYGLLETFEICAWSGELGPKFKEGDRQAPEGFYMVSRGQMNPNSSYHLSFDLGFPNAYDRSHGRTGSHLMVHGDCSSRGCYAVEDGPVEQIYALAREAFAGGQRAFQVQAFPFRMTPQNMARHHGHEHFAFWEMLKEGSDHFEVTRRPPRIDVCEKRYVFNASSSARFVPAGACPEYTVASDVARLVEEKRLSDLAEREKEIERLRKKEEREDRWAEREAAIAAFFNQEEDLEARDTAEVAAGETAAGSTVAVAGIPVPRRSPLAGDPRADGGGGFSFPNPFRRREEPVASTSGVDAGIDRRAAETDDEVPVVSTFQPEERIGDRLATAEAENNAEDERGFLGNVAEGTRGIFRRAGNLFN